MNCPGEADASCPDVTDFKVNRPNTSSRLRTPTRLKSHPEAPTLLLRSGRPHALILGPYKPLPPSPGEGGRATGATAHRLPLAGRQHPRAPYCAIRARLPTACPQPGGSTRTPLTVH